MGKETLASLQEKLATAHRAIQAHEASAQAAAQQVASVVGVNTLLSDTVDRFLGPIVRLLNKAAQGKAKVPFWLWRLLPSAFRDPIDEVFSWVYQYEQWVANGQRSSGAPINTNLDTQVL